jgi:hypothetical protein
LGFGWLNGELLAFLDEYVLTILESDKPKFSTVESVVYWDGFARFDVYAENIERVLNIVASQEFNHDIAIVAEI